MARQGAKRDGLKAERRPQAGRRAAKATPRGRPRTRWLLKWGAVGAIWSLVGLAGTVVYFGYDLPSIHGAVAVERRPATTVLASDASQVARFGDLTGDAFSVAELPPHLIDAVLAIEDRRFYSHPGIDPIGIVRAMVANWRAGRTVQGGSTITQQLAKNLFLTPERTLRRKVQEALLAVWLDATYTKDDILTAYLNRVYLGAGAYGVDAAARTYFGVPATDVTLHQSAILAGLLKAPSRYSPAANADLAEARARLVLRSMVDAGFVEQAAIDRDASLPPTPRRRPVSGSGARYFADWIVDQVPDFVGFDPVDLVVTTSLDPRLQRAAEAAVARRMSAADAEPSASQAALVALAPDGAILAMVGGRSYGDSQFNRATQARRQPGSAFKPMVYLAALEQGLRPHDMVLDAPVQLAGWAPHNFDDRYFGEITAAEALAQSANTATVRVLERAGIDNAIAVARRLGITSELRRDMSLALGTSELTLLELTGAYVAFANNGHATWPYAIHTIHDRDGVLRYRRQGMGLGEVVRPWHVWELNGMMTAVIESGTGRAAQLDRPAAGKSGTSQDYRDAWFVGFTADLIVGVWVGNDDGAPMDRVTGGGLPARIWRDFMMEAHRGLPARPLPGADTLPPAPVGTPMADAQQAVPAAEPARRNAFEDLIGRLLDRL
ncbi:MAG: transglycosylase domain-containing protein [Inquilinaceae bacterium]